LSSPIGLPAPTRESMPVTLKPGDKQFYHPHRSMCAHLEPPGKCDGLNTCARVHL
jgi:hypothetical protein